MTVNLRTSVLPAALLLALSLIGEPCSAQTPPSPLKGTWVLVTADVLYPDGKRTHDYGENPKGRLMVDAEGRYSLQIFSTARPRFASGDKATGTPDEFRAAIMGVSTHFGTMSVDEATHTLNVAIDNASYPNWEGTLQKRQYVLKGDELSYKVLPRADGSVPISIWRRVK